jgi:hypothetical protein
MPNDELVRLALLGLSIVVSLLVWFSIFRKTGFSKYWGLLGLVPLLPLFIPIVLAFIQWPAERELARLRVISGTGTEKDAYAFLDQGARLRTKGKHQEALQCCTEVVNRFQGTDAGKDAEIMIEELKRMT